MCVTKELAKKFDSKKDRVAVYPSDELMDILYYRSDEICPLVAQRITTEILFRIFAQKESQ